MWIYFIVRKINKHNIMGNWSYFPLKRLLFFCWWNKNSEKCLKLIIRYIWSEAIYTNKYRKQRLFIIKRWRYKNLFEILNNLINENLLIWFVQKKSTSNFIISV